jgi:hypothetical protein
VRSFLIALADATLNPATGALIVYLTGTVIGLRTWPPPRRPVRRAPVDMAGRRAALAVVKGRLVA